MRRTIKYLGGISAFALMSASSAAHAQSAEDWAAMKAELAEMRGEIDALEARVDAQQGELAAARAEASAAEARADAAETRFAAIEAGAADKAAAEVAWKGAPSFEGEGGWSFKPRGRIQYDVARVTAPGSVSDPGLGFSNELRRGRLGVQGDMPGGFGYKFEVDFADNDVAFAEAYVDYSHGGLTVTAGQHNNFQSIEELTSSLDTSFIERAAFTDAFGFEYRVGLSAQYALDDLLLQGGVFTANIDGLTDDENNTAGASGRIAYMPRLGDTRLHLAASAHWRDLGHATPSVRYRQRPMVHTTDTRFIDTGAIPADAESNYGVEAGILSGRLHGAAELHWQRLDRTGGSDPTFFGGYGEIGYFLTDNARVYKGGVFKGPKVANGLEKGGMGAVQLVARYDYLDLNDAGIFGGKQSGYELGVNWWPSQYVRLMLDYGRLEYEDAVVATGSGSTDYGLDVVSGRVQLSF